MSKEPPDYTVGYGKPPLYNRFRKGTSGNAEGARRRARRPATRREAIVAGLVEKSTAGDLRATKLLLDLVVKTELAAGPAPASGAEDDPREMLLRKLARLSAAIEADDTGDAAS